MVVIRQAKPQDAQGIRRVLKAAVTTLIGSPYTRAQIDAWIADEEPARFTGRLALGTVFVAVAERCVIGFARIGSAEVEALYVHPAESGRKVGLRLLAALERSAATHDVKTLRLDAAISAVSFYESAGYRILGPSQPRFDNGVALPCIRMQKVLHFERREKQAAGLGLDRCHPRNTRIRELVTPQEVPEF